MSSQPSSLLEFRRCGGDAASRGVHQLVGPPSEFAQQLRSFRNAQGLTVRGLAERVGVSKVTIWKWEKGDVQPRARMIAPLAKALHIPPDRLQPLDDGQSAGLSFDGHLAANDDLHQVESLADVVARAKRMLAEASGVSPQNIVISIEY